MNSTASTHEVVVSLADIDRARKAIEGMPPEPFAEFMRSKGYPPEVWALVFPASFLGPGDNPSMLPSYVRVSSAVRVPVFVRRDTL